MDSYPGYYGHSAAACVHRAVPSCRVCPKTRASEYIGTRFTAAICIHAYQFLRSLNVCSFHVATIVLHLVLAHVVVIAGLLV